MHWVGALPRLLYRAEHHRAAEQKREPNHHAISAIPVNIQVGWNIARWTIVLELHDGARLLDHFHGFGVELRVYKPQIFIAPYDLRFWLVALAVRQWR
jgi:hypothetical protein